MLCNSEACVVIMSAPLPRIVGACGTGTYDVGLDGGDRSRSVRSSEVSGWKRMGSGGNRLSQRSRAVQRDGDGFTEHTRVSPLMHMRWWEKSSIPNMAEIKSADELVHSLLNAGDKLVVVDFYAPGCGACRALHPKICQIAESNPSTIFPKVNYDEHKAMCNILHIHVLPFFRFYRDAQGRVCSFSCTNATIKKVQRRTGQAWIREMQSWTCKRVGRIRATELSSAQGCAFDLPTGIFLDRGFFSARNGGGLPCRKPRYGGFSSRHMN